MEPYAKLIRLHGARSLYGTQEVATMVCVTTCIFPSFSGSTTSASTFEVTTDAIAGAIGTDAGNIGAQEADMMPLPTLQEKGARGIPEGGL